MFEGEGLLFYVRAVDRQGLIKVRDMPSGVLDMPTAEKLISIKKQPLATISTEATVLDAARLMNERRIGSVLVMEGAKLSGIFTERDLMTRVVARQGDPSTTRVAAVMTSPVAVAAGHTTLNELRGVMREKRIRHVPVVDENTVLGMISIGDLNRAEHDVQEQTIRYLEQYMSVG